MATTQRPTLPPMQSQQGSTTESPRFEATVHPGMRTRALTRVSDLRLELLPDASGELRVLVDAEGITELLEGGYEVRLQRAVPLQTR